MTVRVYKSTDVGAPSKFYGAGTVTDILDACLVNGYGTKVAAGWSKPYSGTNIAVYKGVGPNAKYLRVDDSSTSSSVDVSCYFAAYHTMSDVNTGTDKFPPASAVTNGYMFSRSGSSSGGPSVLTVPWVVVATEGFFWFVLGTAPDAELSSTTSVVGFGEFPSRVMGDNNNTVLIGDKTSGTGQVIDLNSLPASVEASSICLAASYDGSVKSNVITSIHTAHASDHYLGLYDTDGTAETAYPEALSNAIQLYPLRVYEKGVGYRGSLPGLFHTKTNYTTAALRTFSTVSLGAREFIIMRGTLSSAYGMPLMALEISDTW